MVVAEKKKKSGNQEIKEGEKERRKENKPRKTMIQKWHRQTQNEGNIG